MEPALIIEFYAFVQDALDLLQIRKSLLLEQFIFHRIVDALRRGIVFWISIFCHTDGDGVLLQHARIFGADVLHSTIRMMD